MRNLLVPLIVSIVLFHQGHSFEVKAARFPDSVEKKIIFRGDKAIEIAQLLGFEKTHESEGLYPLKEQDARAIALREHPQDPTHVPDKHRPNRIRFIPKPEPSLIIEGNWLDSHTGSSPANPRFLFNSPVISENSGLMDWVRLLDHLLAQAYKSKDDGSYWETVFEQVISDKGDPIFSITVSRVRDKGVPPNRKGYFILIRSNDPR